MQSSLNITIAVLPFEDLSADSGFGIFCRSFSGDLITGLSKFRQFQVLTLNNTEQASPSSKLFDTFESDYFVHGTFRGHENVLRINVQLYNSLTRHIVWGNRIEGKLEELNDMQEQLLAEIVDALQHQINVDLLSQIKRRNKVRFKAYEHWLHGMDELKKGSIQHDLIARTHFQKALEIEPDYSLAYTGMSLTYFNEWSCQLWDKWDVSKTGAQHFAEKAIEIDDQNHIAAMVLGKYFLYNNAYTSAEYYFRTSLQLNSNDPDTLLQMSVCFLFLGLENECLSLYQKAMKLNPLNAHRYFPYGTLIYFELGEFEKAASLIRLNQKIRIANAEAYYAAVYYYLNDYASMNKHWQLMLENYQQLIARDKPFTTEDVVKWIEIINPYRSKTNLDGFFRHISRGQITSMLRPSAISSDKTEGEAEFLKEPLGWRITYEDLCIQIAEMKGLHDIAKMISQPHRLFHCAELMGVVVDNRGNKLLDEKARNEYRQKILRLQGDIRDADENGDYRGLEKLQLEYDQLVTHLSKSLGLKGKSRETGGSVEKARSAVTWRIRNTIARIEQLHPRLGAHFNNSIKTGLVCSYQPDREINWVINQ